MKLRTAVFTAALAASLCSSVMGQTTRVAYVDIDRVTEKSDKINKAMGNVTNRVEGIQQDVEKKRKRLAELKVEIKKGEGVLADAELKKRKDESGKLEKELVDLEYEGRRELQKLDSTLFEPMIKTIVLAIQDVARDKKIDLVLRGEAVIYGADVADITDAVVLKLNSPDFNPGASVKTDKSMKADKESSSDSTDSTSESKSSTSSESETAAKASPETGSAEGSTSKGSAGSKSIIPNIPLKSRPVDRQAD